MIAALIAHLWESSLFALAVACLTLLFRNNGAHVRYWLWFAASMKFLIPFSLLAALGRAAGPKMVTVTVPESIAVMTQSFAAPAILPVATLMPTTSVAPIDWTLPVLALWALGFLAVVAVWTMQWLRIRRALAAASPVALDVDVPVRMTAMDIEPGLVGIFRPVILLPRGTTQQLTGGELRAILAHELCHLRRRDNLTAALHMLVQAIFWFHPLLWWIGTRLVAERERACDEAVTRSGGSAQDYAAAILTVCRLQVGSALMCVSGVSGANLKRRIERIVGDVRTRPLGAMKSVVIGAAAAMALAGPMLLGWTSTDVRASSATTARALASKQSHPDVRTARFDTAARDARSGSQSLRASDGVMPADPVSAPAPAPFSEANGEISSAPGIDTAPAALSRVSGPAITPPSPISQLRAPYGFCLNSHFRSVGRPPIQGVRLPAAQRIDGCTALIQSVRLTPDDLAGAYFNRGLAYASQGDYARAITDYEEAIRLSPRFPHAYKHRGIAYQEQHNYARAIADYSEAVRQNPSIDSAFNNRGYIYYSQRDFARAIADYGAVIRLLPQNAEAYINRGNAYRAQGDNARAAADFDEAAQLRESQGGSIVICTGYVCS